MCFKFRVTSCLSGLPTVEAEGLQQHFEISPNKDLVVSKGSKATIGCKVRNLMGECLWLHDGKGISPIRDKYEFKRTPENGDCSLTILQASPENDNGKWQCQATAAALNQETLQSDIITLDVLYAPRLISISSPQSVLAGQPARIHCLYDGKPAPIVKFYHINPRTGDTIPINNYNSDNGQILEIRNTTYYDEGEYFCEATNRINTVDYVVRSGNMVLDVYGTPAFLTASRYSTEGRRGSQSHVTMWFCSDPPPVKVYWQFGSIRLDVKPQPAIPGVLSTGSNSSAATALLSRYQVKPIIPLHSKRGLESAANCYDSTLLINDTDLSDQRDYTLVIENERGRQEAVVKLRVINPLSATLLIATALTIIICVFVISIITLMCIRQKKRKTDSGPGHHEAKEDAQAISRNLTKSTVEQATKEADKRNGRKGSQPELAYATIDFSTNDGVNGPTNGGTNGHGHTHGGIKGMKVLPPIAVKPLPRSASGPKPPIAPKPDLSQHRDAASTEYAQIVFTSQADL